MLDVFRQHSRSSVIYILFGILIVVFLLTFNSPGQMGATGAAAVDVMAEVAGTPIDSAELNLAMQLSADPPAPTLSGYEKLVATQNYERSRLAYSGVAPELRQLTPFEGPAPAIKMEKVLAELTESVLVAADARKHGLAVSDAELSRRVLALEKVFGTSFKDESGAFDPKKYDAFVRFSLGSSKAGLEQFLRRELLRDKMAQVVSSGIVLTQAEIDGLHAADYGRPVLEVVTLDAVSAARALTVTDEEANAFAAANPDKVKAAYDLAGEKYKVPEKVNVRGILVAAPSKDETDPAKKQAAEDTWAQKKKDAETLRADLDKAWAGEVALDPLAPTATGDEAPPAPEADGKKATDLAPEEKTARLLQFFSKTATEKTEHSMTKDNGGKFVEDYTADSLKRTPFGPAVADAVLAADVGALVGPVEGSQGWWLLVVEKKLPGSETPLATVQTDLARGLVQQERAATEIDKIAADFHKFAAGQADKPLAEVVKAWNKAKSGNEDEGLRAMDTPPIGKSPVQALTAGFEEMLGLPPKVEDPDAIPGIGRHPELVQAAWKLGTEAPLADRVFKSEDGKSRFVVRRATPKADATAEAAAKVQTARIVTTVRRAEAWRAYVKKLTQKAEADGKIERTDAFALLVQAERDKLAAAAKRAPAPPPAGLGGIGGMGGMQLNPGAPGGAPIELKLNGQEVPVAPGAAK